MVLGQMLFHRVMNSLDQHVLNTTLTQQVCHRRRVTERVNCPTTYRSHTYAKQSHTRQASYSILWPADTNKTKHNYTVFQKKEATKLLAITFTNLNQFWKFFHCSIEDEYLQQNCVIFSTKKSLVASFFGTRCITKNNTNKRISYCQRTVRQQHITLEVK